MTDKEPLPVAGYTAQSDEKIALVNSFKQDEERLLRKISKMRSYEYSAVSPIGIPRHDPVLEEAEKYFMIAFMLLNRAVFQPQRIKLPEDEMTKQPLPVSGYTEQ